MILEMKVPSPGESITEVEIATWLVEDGDYVEKDQPIAEVDSDKATLELPAEESGIITLKAEEGDAVEVGAIVCLIDMDGKKPEGTALKGEKSSETTITVEKPADTKTTYASGSASPAAKKILEEKGISASEIKGRVSFNFEKTNKTMLKIKADFREPKTPPAILLSKPKEAKSAIFVNILPSKAMTKTISPKVMANATMVI